MIINIISSSRYKIERKKIKNHINEIINKKVGVIFSYFNLIIVGKRKMKTLSIKYKNENVPLPVLTFYYNEEDTGEIFICYSQMILLAAEKNKTVDYILNSLIEHGIENLIKQKNSYKDSFYNK